MYDLGKEEIEALTELLNSKKLFRYQGNFLSQCQLFEKEFSQYMSSGPSLLLTSGTNALLNGLKSLGVGEGDEVLVPSFTFVATPAAVVQAGAKVVLVNINESLTMCPADLKKKITPNTKAIIPVHMDGLHCEMELILAIAKEHKLLVIEDVAQAVGGSYKGKKLGTFGEAGCFSFNADKIITCGEGGAVIYRDEATYKKGLLFHDPGIAYGLTYKDYLKSLSPVSGISMRTSEISGTLMRVQLLKLDRILNELRERKTIMMKILEDNGVDFISPLDSKGDCGTSLHLRMNDPIRASQICRDLQESGLVVIPVGARPAHTYSQWIDLLSLSDEERKSNLTDLSPSRLILASTLKVFIQTEWSPEETKAKALEIVRKLQK